MNPEERNIHVVHCATKQEARNVLNEAANRGWAVAELLDRWDTHRDETVYFMDLDRRVTYSRIEYADEEGYTVLSASDYLAGPKAKPLSPHQAALKNLALEPGDMVKVLCAVPSHTGGWPDHWVAAMTNAVGGTFQVYRAHPDQVVLALPSSTYTFPAFCLELVSRKTSLPSYPTTFQEWDVSIDTQTKVLRIGCQHMSLLRALALIKGIRATLDTARKNGIVLPTINVLDHDTDVPPLVAFIDSLEPALRGLTDKP